jgi:hypothetical protein
VADRKGDLTVRIDLSRKNQVVCEVVEGAAEMVDAVPQTGQDGIGNTEDIIRNPEGFVG